MALEWVITFINGMCGRQCPSFMKLMKTLNTPDTIDKGLYTPDTIDKGLYITNNIDNVCTLMIILIKLYTPIDIDKGCTPLVTFIKVIYP